VCVYVYVCVLGVEPDVEERTLMLICGN
jgi:hypothetical protein